MGRVGKGATLAIEVRPAGKEPVFLALARAIVAEIERGRLNPGDPLPGTRALSKSLSLNRNTVDAAYQELVMQGWLAAEPSRGTFVAGDLPESGRAPVRAMPAAEAEVVCDARPMLSLSDGAPDPRLAPVAALGRAFRRALAAPSFLAGGGYGDPRGSPALREALSLYLREERGLTVQAGDILITRGSQMALFLAAAAVAEPGSAIAVETPGYPLAWAAFRAAGARVVGVPVDEGGIVPDALERLAEREPRLKAVYVTPHHQYPTTVTLGAARRLRLMGIARRFRLTVIEDDYDHEYRFEGRPVLPLAARAEPDVPAIHLGSLSKLIAPGIRIGYAVAPAALLRRMADRREAIDRQGDVPLEQALAGIIADGTLARHARKARRIYHARRDSLAALLTERLGGSAAFTLPAGGLAIWLRLRQNAETPAAESWAANAARLGLSVLPGVRFALDVARPPEAFRLGFAGLDEAELARAVELFVKAAHRA
ncbi:GntR family transcriptional regulator/MocR family aminotransferase [Pseudochelatococcus lubricantis]|uniref:GntR family transcriptional regulator/MocR family aminotransferase n=1 Tax=Pseudochelatococcus lubricantis TaxID=1538102 RepID=A0ABX0V4F3_9HYPH|nr:PLP-dependent aminotransferase family protein [Pseudochelatococcus lubricantis]NIJ58675.1 GntR family transcriptional regulator/MocR family aminotransferase [Pseudochelatococcus lubricantis]